MSQAYDIIGVPQGTGTLIVVDHASNFVPNDIDLGLSQTFSNDHISHDIGVKEIANIMAEAPGNLAILGGTSRLVVDLNRYPDEEAVIPLRSDGVEVTGNVISEAERHERMVRFFHPYHNRVAELIFDLKPALVLSLHSFTPKLRSDSLVQRPWDVGVMYNEYEAASKMALQFFTEEGLVAGDQKPYSGKELNATMNRQAETVGQPYLGVEIRQDLIAHETGQRRFADILLRTCEKIRTGLA